MAQSTSRRRIPAGERPTIRGLRQELLPHITELFTRVAALERKLNVLEVRQNSVETNFFGSEILFITPLFATWLIS